MSKGCEWDKQKTVHTGQDEPPQSLLLMENKTELFDDLAEQYVLWNINCQLERELVFPTDYADAIAQARETVKKNY